MAAERFLSLRIADLPMVLAGGAHLEVGLLASRSPRSSPTPATSIRPGPLLDRGRGRRIAARLATGVRGRLPPRIRNPFLEQLVSEVRAEGIEPTAASAERVASLGPDTVRASVLLRLGRLPAAGAPWRARCGARRARRDGARRRHPGRRARGRRR